MIRVSVIDDEPVNQNAYKTHIEMEFVDAGKRGQVKVSTFGDVFEAHDTPADLILIDISAIAPLNTYDPKFCYGSIAQLASDRPGCTIVIISAMSMGFMEDVKEMVLNVIPDANIILIDSSSGWKELDKVIATFTQLEQS